MNKQAIVEKYKNISIGITNRNENIFCDRILNNENLKHFLYNIYGPQDESLTEEGLKFLDEYYGLGYVAELIMQEIRNGVDYDFKNEQEITVWLENGALGKWSK